MQRMGERAYAYAKACGIIGKSFVGKRMKGLESAHRLSELDRLVFPLEQWNLPEKELLHNLEGRITDRAVNSIISIVECFSKPPELLTLLLRSYEYADLKNALISALGAEKTAPAHTDLGRYQTVRFEKWPDVRAMIEGTEFEFLLDKEGVLYRELGSVQLQTVLDRRYYGAIWNSLSGMPQGDRQAAEKILSAEISLRNSGWALRLRSYYWMSAEEVKLHLIDIPVKGPERSLAQDAIRCLEFPLDNFSSWSSWRWKEFLNPDAEGGYWHADARHFQNSASRYLFHLARHHFHLRPFSMDTIFCFIKIKQFEEDVLTSGAEGLGMGLSSREILSMLGVEP